MKQVYFKILPNLIVFLFFLSCRQGSGSSLEEWCGKRDRIEEVELCSIEEKLPAIHSSSTLFMSGDTLIVHDFKSTDMQFFAYDIKEDKYIGQFGKFGEGPGEIANVGNVMLDPNNKMLYCLNGSKWQIEGFDIPAALSDPGYRSFFKTKLKEIDGISPIIITGKLINDSIAYCEVRLPDADWREISSRIGRLNLNDGSLMLIEESGNDKKSRNYLTLSLKNKLIVSTAWTHDRVRLFDLEGNLKKVIYGPDYTDSQKNPNKEYYSYVCIGRDGIYAAYMNDDIRRKQFATDIIVMDLDGKYQKTLHVGKFITGIQYNETYNRIYISTTAYPQFGYIQL